VTNVVDDAELGEILAARRPELLRHCYRMLGALGDAEDLVQETCLRAWDHRERFEGRATVRTWLFRIATNACLNAIEHRARRRLPEQHQPAAELGESVAPRMNEPIWLEPFPGDGAPADLEGATERREHVALAFVMALQELPARQRAVLLLRDVVGWDTKDVASALETSVGGVESALFRARKVIAELAAEPDAAREIGPDERALLGRYLSAWERGDVADLVAVLREDAIFSMPPVPTWFRGRAAIRTFLETSAPFQRFWREGFRLRPTVANGSPAFGVYKGGAGAAFLPHGLMVTGFWGGAIARVTTFLDPGLFPRFALPTAA
jgi:RNA polymerase sigma-70 factor (ECF subfamily)